MNLILDLLGSLSNFLISPLPIFRFGVLRQGSDKFYSLSFQAILSLFFWLLGLSLAWKLSSLRISLSPLDWASPLRWLKMGGGKSKNINSAFFRSYFVPFCYAIKKYSLFVTHSKMAILQSLTTFRLLFIYFLSCVYTGCYSDPVACGAPNCLENFTNY